MAQFQPPPTYAEVVLVDSSGQQGPKFNPIWLKWFLDLVKGLNSGGAGSGSVISISTNPAANQGATISASVTNPTTTPIVNITIGLGAITPTSVAATGGVSAGTTLVAGTSITAGTVLAATTKLFPSTAAGALQTATSLYGGTGAPNNADGNDGDYYFRSNGGVATHIYFKAAGAWAGII